MFYKVYFSNGVETSFEITKQGDLFYSEILTGRIFTQFNPDDEAFSFSSIKTLETKAISGESIESVLKKAEDLINELKDPSISFTINKFSSK